MAYPHLVLSREEPINNRRGYERYIPNYPDNPSQHGHRLLNRLAHVREAPEHTTAFDGRHLLKLTVAHGFNPDELRAIPGVEIVSQEQRDVVLAFTTEEALATFEQRLATLSQGGTPTRRELLYALQDFSTWTPDDRKGWALRSQGYSQREPFFLDVELWPLTTQRDREAQRDAFVTWCAGRGLRISDSIFTTALAMFRVEGTAQDGDALLSHPSVRVVDLPPRFGVQRAALAVDVQTIPQPALLPDSVPSVVVLDSGIAAGHPLLRGVVGDAQGYLPDGRADDPHGHGTMVAGIAVYGDIKECLASGAFVPTLRLFSGRILDERNEFSPRFIENQIREAVEYFRRNYNCRIFNLSIGDRNKPYRGGRVGGVAFTLDQLSRDLDVLFVVSTGNFDSATRAIDWHNEYPHYLLSEDAYLLDPAPALNALTVGSIARHDAGHNAQRYPHAVEERPIAQIGQPSPFTRCGPPAPCAVKPEIVAPGGNQAIDPRLHGRLRSAGLGEVSLSNDFANGQVVVEDIGTSLAAPRVAHLAAKLLSVVEPATTVNLIRALIAAHARVPAAAHDLPLDAGAMRRLCGYGEVDEEALFSSDEQNVTMYAEDRIADRRHHFYEIPIPEDLFSRGRRDREVTVALAHVPPTRTTRVDYKASRMSFKLVDGESLENVANAFNADTSRDDFPGIPELATRDISEQDRARSTVQRATFTFRSITSQRRNRKLFVVVTRMDSNWAAGLVNEEEPYALVVCMRDRENETAMLYQQIAALLRARARQRARV